MSDQSTNLFERVAELTERYMLGSIDAAELEALEALVRSDPRAAVAMRQIMQQVGTMRVIFGEQRDFASTVAEADREEFLAMLQSLEPVQEPELVCLDHLASSTIPFWKQWSIVVPSAIAAVLAIALVLVVSLPKASTQPSTAQTETPQRFTASPPPTTQQHPVATLTATHNATWAGPASAAPAPGSALHPGTRLTLTAGFAEITTHRGAIAILQAPATIELINNNALHLHAGKLVGICPTITSRGFTIETPAAQVVDIGTRFGVAVEADGQTAVEVFAGEVTVAPVIDGQLKPATRLLTRQAAKVTHGKVQPVAASLKPAQSRFAEALAFAEADPDTLDVLKDPAAIAHYSFDQPGGDTLPESRGQALFDAQIIGAQWTQGPHPGTHALNFTGKSWDERIVLSDQASARLDLQGDFTIALWINLRTCPDNGWSPLLTKGSDAWRILASRDRKTREPQVGFYWSQSEDKPGMRYAGAATGDQDIELNRWHHLIVTGQADDTGEGATIRLYLDGELKTEQHFPRTLTSDSPVAIGAVQLDKGTLAFDGRLGEVAFLSRAISEDEVGKLYTPIHTPPQ